MSKETVKTTLPFDPCCKEYETHHYEITPEQASYILKKHNKDNRKFSQSHTDNIYNSILRDRWYKDGQPITFNTDGNLTEAQHRLSAIAKFEGQDVRFEIIVTTGVEPDCFSKCQPAKPRRPIDEVQRKYSEVTKSQYAILADILPKHGQKVKIQTIVKEWEIWKKYVLEGDRLIDNEYYGNAENTQQYTSQRKTVGAWAAQSILNRRDSYARKFLELLSNDLDPDSDIETPVLITQFNKYFIDNAPHLPNAQRLLLLYKMLCVAIDRLIINDEGNIQFIEVDDKGLPTNEDVLSDNTLMSNPLSTYCIFAKNTPK
tara:strand:+ start:220 stop:1167 length:948 start_codon:yes stop_codon:yes gene_type:complete